MRVNRLPARHLRPATPGQRLKGLGDAMDVVSSLDTASGAIGDASDALDSLGVDSSVTSALTSVGSALSDASDQLYSATGQDSTLEPINVTGTTPTSGLSPMLIFGALAAVGGIWYLSKKR